jgi:Tfp pilus assembly protein PilF
MAVDALSAEPKNERARLAVARHELGTRRYAQVQENLQALTERGDLSAASHRDLGMVLSTLLRSKDEAMPGTAGVDSKATRAATRTHFQRAIALAPNDPRALYQLGWLMCAEGDVAGTRELLPTVEAAFYRRPQSAEFAELLVRMHSIAGNTADVFKYAVAEQRLAATETERARASARVERLRAQLKSAPVDSPQSPTTRIPRYGE